MTMITVAEALDEAAAMLRSAGVDRPRLDARLLLAHALGIAPEHVIGGPDRRVDPVDRERFRALTARRARRESVARLTGVREFWSLPFRVTADTLEPRPDSETVVEAALAALDAAEVPRDRSLAILDLGTGTGCLLLALLRELPAARGLGVDISPAACAVARANAGSLGLAGRARFCAGDWGRGLGGRFDLIVANPPYIPDDAIDGLQPEVARYEPRSALAGGPDGLACHRALAPQLHRLLADGGMALVEFGAGQGRPVGQILAAAGFTCVAVRCDLAGLERCIVVRRAKAAEKRKKQLEIGAVPSSFSGVEAASGPS
jgi:release factor glutamine methyltransferase